MCNLFKNVEFGISLFSISVICSIISITFSNFSGKTFSGRLEFLFVFSESSLLVFEGRFNFG